MNRVQIKIIKDALEYPELLDEWEHNFVDFISDKEDDYELSEKQSHALNAISQKLL